MATDKPRLQLYVKPELLSKLESYARKHNHGSANQAANAILQRHFGMFGRRHTVDRLELLERRVQELDVVVRSHEIRLKELGSRSAANNGGTRRRYRTTASMDEAVAEGFRPVDFDAPDDDDDDYDFDPDPD